MLGSPAPLTSHWLCGVPGRQFSLSIAFAGEPQSAWALEDSAKDRRRAKKAPLTGVPNFILHSLEVRSDQLCTRKARLLPKTSAAARLLNGKMCTCAVFSETYWGLCFDE